MTLIAGSSASSTGKNRSSMATAMTLTAVIGGSALLSACGGSGGGDGTGNQETGACSAFDCQAMLENVADNVVIPAMIDFEARANHLESAVSAWRADQNNDTLKQEARQAWNDAMDAWQRVEVMQTGPLTDNSSLLRDSIYSWPSTSTCAVDQEVIEAEEQGDNYDISARTPLRKGLDALEYILHTDTLEHTCASNVTKTSSWNGRTDSERLSARLAYAQAAGEDVHRQSLSVVERWGTGTGNFRDELVNAGSGGSRFNTSQEAVNAVSDALFYVEKQVKDIKLAEPLALKGDKCEQGTSACAEFVENPISARSKEHLRQNILAFQRVFLGNSADGSEGLGFDDLIDAVNGDNVSAAMETDINEVLIAIDNLGDRSLKEAVTDSNGVNLAKGVHESTKKVTDRLKNDFLQVLGLSIPAAAAGDGD
ncbi:Predicted lipoprotein [Marinobacter daqiaonensis]|uniref:Predicted lipoprotein n=1 Tax=Marinobacter daqiaonensis TaxID=650891 RepID=A0A1I6IEY2_9GAMM|nr:imelysin family protein [Marinobacter daqiaonensis]SFR65302.1 Predicted lipoprotein [Marinobacter daqiaonensis]